MILPFRIIVFFLLAGMVAGAQNKVSFIIRARPLVSEKDEFYLAGSFNGWNPQNRSYLFKAVGEEWHLTTDLNNGRHEFKITRGGWDKVETDPRGNNISNRVVEVNSDTVIHLDVSGWADQFAKRPRVSTAGRKVKIIDTAFSVPQLNRTRRIWIYLPPEYDGRVRCPVMYMHDGQNVFEDTTSFSGEWGVDECIDTLAATEGGTIVVAIDNGGDKRLNEYSPYDFSLSSGNPMRISGEGDAYLEFIVNTLKPFIDRNYRTKRSKKHTSMAGSSMGGLITMYALLKYPKVFGGAGVFSPAFWVAPGIFDDIKAKGGRVKSKIFFYAGVPESETMAPLTLRAHEEMLKVSKSRMITVIRAEGQHNEQRWRKEFEGFYKWLKN